MSEGEVVAGCRLVRLLGAGAMGEVYLAVRLSDHAQVVVKRMAVGLDDPTLRARFRREGEALLRLRPHPNVVRVLGLDVDAARPALVMEHVEGETLLARVRRLGPLPPDDAAALARDLALGLDAVHGQGLVHRDVKPDNALVGPSGQVKLVDFGLVKDVFASTNLTAPDQVVGTGAYMAPERWQGGEEPSPASDVFALGATLYHLLVGRPPFEGATLEDVASNVLAGRFAPPRAARPEVSPDLERVVLHMLATEPGLRPASARHCALDLERVLHGQPPEVPALLLPAGGRVPLVPGKRWVMGSAPACEVRVEAERVAPTHAQLRRTPAGFELRDLRSGTQVNGAPLAAAGALLRDGDVVGIGAASLRFDDPAGRPQPPPLLRDATRVVVPGPVLEAARRLGHPGATLADLEALDLDPPRRRLVASLAAPHARAAVQARALDVARARAADARRRLARHAGADLGPDPVAWWAWWDGARAAAPPQLGPPPPGALRLHLAGQGAAPGGRPAGGSEERAPAGLAVSIELPTDAGVLLVGRDSRCHVRLSDRATSRHHATLLRMHERLLVRDEGRAGGTRVDGQPVARLAALDPGATLGVGEAALVLESLRVHQPPPLELALALEAAGLPAADAWTAWLGDVAESRAALARSLPEGRATLDALIAEVRARR